MEAAQTRYFQDGLQRQILDHMAEGVIMTRRRDGIIMYTSPIFERMFGYEHGELVGKYVSIVNAPEPKSPDETALELMAYVAAHGLWRGEIYNIKKDGTMFWCRASISEFDHPEYGPVWISVHQDIDQAKKAECALRVSEERYRLLAENSSDMISLHNPDGTFVYASPSYSRIRGFTSEEVCSMPAEALASLVHPDDLLRTRNEAHDQVLSGEKISRLEYRARCKDGSYLWVETHSTPILNDAGQVVQIVAAARDISERKHIEEEIRRQNEFLAAMHVITIDLLQERDTNELLQSLVECATVILDAPYGELMLKEGDDLVVRAFTNNQPFLRGDRVARGEACLTWQAYDNGYPAVVDDYMSRSKRRPIYEDLKLRAVAAFPIMAGDSCLGVLDLSRSEPDRPFQPDEIQHGILFSQLAALVLQNARLYDKALSELSERNRTEKALQESKQRYDALVENIPAMVYRLRETPDGEVGFDYVSPRARQINGVEPEAVLRDRNLLWNQIHPDEFERLMELQEESARNLTPFLWEGRFVIGGELRWMYLESRPQQLDDGTVIWDGIQLDLTHQRQVESALRESERRTRALLDAIPDLVFRLTVDGEFVDFKGAASDLLVPPDQIIGRTMREVGLPPEFIATTLAFAQRAISENQIQTYEYQLPLPTQGIQDYEARLVASSDNEVTAIVRNVTARKVLENQQRRLTAELQTANQELKDFAYVISHDLKAPLRGVSSIASWLSSDYAAHFDEEGRELLTLLTGRVRRMEQMINGVLEYSRIGRVNEARVAVDLNEVVNGIIGDVVSPERVQVIIENPLPTLVIEPTRIVQIFQNLIDNAVKFMDKPVGEIRIGCEPQGEMWKFWVRDNGPGIEAQHFVRIFQIFQTLAPRDVIESTGVGLAIIKRIVELYEGKIWVEAEVGQGSTFYFTLPQ